MNKSDRRTPAMATEGDWTVEKKQKESKKLIEKALRSSVHLRHIISDKRVLKALIEAMTEKSVDERHYVTKAGKSGDEMFVCASGSLVCYSPHDDNHKRKIGPGEVFGQMAFICFSEREATVRAETKCRLWVLHHENYVKILKKYYTFKDEDYVSYLQQIPILSQLSYATLLHIRESVKVRCYAANTVIIRQGDEGSQFYIITGGNVLISVMSSDGRTKIVDKLGKGDFFGECALLEDGKTNASVTAEPPGVECIILDKLIFSQFLDRQAQIRSTWKRRLDMIKTVMDKDLEYHFIKLEDLEVKDIISNCSLGRIDIVEYKSHSGVVFALKTLKINEVAENDLIQNVLNEKEILLSCRSPFIVRLYKTFKDKKYLYYLEEACLGGNLRHLLTKYKLDENMARFVVACVIEAFDYLHSRGIVYQNLKAENLVIDSNGYIKLVDFGLARQIKKNEGKCPGTGPDKSIKEEPDISYDYQSLGSLTFQLLINKLQDDETAKSEQSRIDGNKYASFPNYVTNEAISFLKKLSKNNIDLDEIRNHKWFQMNGPFQWQSLQNETMIAPYIPKIRHPTDVSNFPESRKDKEIPPDNCDEWHRHFESY